MSSYAQKQQQPQGNSGGRFADYIGVAERIGEFYKDYPEGRINSTIIEHDQQGGFILMRAEVYRRPDDASPAGTGHAYEMKSEGHVNKTSYIENCETGAVGRALANLGYETKRGNGTQSAPRLAPAPTQRQEECASPVAASDWKCGDELKKSIMDFESACEENGLSQKYLRDKLEASKGVRNPAYLSLEDAASYRDWLKQSNEKARQRSV